MSPTIKIERTKEGYSYEIYDGPDGIDEEQGVCNTLGEVFEKIISFRAVNALNYYEA